MRQILFCTAGLLLISLASGCCCWDQCGYGCNPCGGNQCSPCGPGGCTVPQYGQPYNTGAYYTPGAVQQVYAPAPMMTVGPVESLPTYY